MGGVDTRGYIISSSVVMEQNIIIFKGTETELGDTNPESVNSPENN